MSSSESNSETPKLVEIAETNIIKNTENNSIIIEQDKLTTHIQINEVLTTIIGPQDSNSDDSSEREEKISLKDESADKPKPILKSKRSMSRVTFGSNVNRESKVEDQSNFEGWSSIPNEYQSKRKRSSSVHLRHWRRQSSAFVRRSSSLIVSWAIPRSSFRFSHESTDGGLYERKISFWPPPLMMLTISMVQVILWALEYNEITPDDNISKRPIFNALRYNPCERRFAYRFISYALVHANFVHLIGNVILQVSLGVALEIAHGWWRVLSIYLLGVFGGALGSSFHEPTTGLSGASGGCYGFIFAHIANVLVNWKDMEFGVPQLFIYALYVIVDVILVYLSPVSNISYFSHLFGGLTGLLVGFVILRILTQFEWQNMIGKLAFILFVMFLVSGVTYQISKPDGEFCRTRICLKTLNTCNKIGTLCNNSFINNFKMTKLNMIYDGYNIAELPKFKDVLNNITEKYILNDHNDIPSVCKNLKKKCRTAGHIITFINTTAIENLGGS